jgi:hypothetical protein
VNRYPDGGERGKIIVGGFVGMRSGYTFSVSEYVWIDGRDRRIFKLRYVFEKSLGFLDIVTALTKKIKAIANDRFRCVSSHDAASQPNSSITDTLYYLMKSPIKKGP